MSSISSTACATRACPSPSRKWQGFLRALEQGLHGCNLLRFYHFGRACLIKSETDFDPYDRGFSRVFKGVGEQDFSHAEIIFHFHQVDPDKVVLDAPTAQQPRLAAPLRPAR